MATTKFGSSIMSMLVADIMDKMEIWYKKRWK